MSEADFTRKRKLTLPNIFTMVLSIVGNNSQKGIASKCQDFIRLSKLQDLDLNIESIDKSAISKARNKVHHDLFAESFYKLVDLANQTFPDDSCYKWNNFSVFAVDGSKYTLPATEELREKFDPTSGLQNKGKGHYPQCLVTTVYDVYRRIPIARSVTKVNSSERYEFSKLLDKVPNKNSLLVFDRGYPSYDLFKRLSEDNRFFLFRCPTTGTFKKVQEFLGTEENEGLIEISAPPTNKSGEKIKLRIIISCNPKGEKVVLLTNLLDKNKYLSKEIIELYFKRWEIETNYRNEKTSLNIECFHSKSYNGIMQELFAICILNLIVRLTAATITEKSDVSKKEPQFKNAIITLATNMTIFATKIINNGMKIFIEIAQDILNIKYYRENKKRKSQPRVTKKAISKWYDNRRLKLQIP